MPGWIKKKNPLNRKKLWWKPKRKMAKKNQRLERLGAEERPTMGSYGGRNQRGATYQPLLSKGRRMRNLLSLNIQAPLIIPGDKRHLPKCPWNHSSHLCILKTLLSLPYHFAKSTIMRTVWPAEIKRTANCNQPLKTPKFPIASQCLLHPREEIPFRQRKEPSPSYRTLL